LRGQKRDFPDLGDRHNRSKSHGYVFPKAWEKYTNRSVTGAATPKEQKNGSAEMLRSVLGTRGDSFLAK